MLVIVFTWLFRALGLYLLLGFGVAIWLAFRGLGRIDPVAGGGSFGFRLLVIPGLTALWPFFLKKIMSRAPSSPGALPIDSSPDSESQEVRP